MSRDGIVFDTCIPILDEDLLSPQPFGFTGYSKRLGRNVRIEMKLESVFKQNKDTETVLVYIGECTVPNCNGLLYLRAEHKLGSTEAKEDCGVQWNNHKERFHGRRDPPKNQNTVVTLVRTLGTHTLTAVTALERYMNGIPGCNKTVITDQMPTNALYQAIADTCVNTHTPVRLKERHTPIFSYYVEFTSTDPRMDEMYNLIRKCMSGTPEIYFLRCPFPDRWRMVVPTLKVDAIQACQITNMLRVSTIGIDPPHYVKPLLLLLDPPEFRCYTHCGLSPTDMENKVDYLAKVCIRSPGASSTFSPTHGFPYAAERYAKEAKVNLQATFLEALRVAWSLLMNGCNDLCCEVSNDSDTPKSFRIVPRIQNIGGEYEAYCFDAEPTGWYDSFCPFKKRDHTDGKVMMRVRPKAMTITAHLYCSVCRRQTETLSCGDANSISLRNPDHTQRNDQPVKLKVEDAEKRRIIEQYIHKRLKYAKSVVVKSIYTDKSGSKYYIYVEGEGSSWCANLRGHHNRTRVWFYLGKEGISQRCFCRCSAVRFKGCCADFQCPPKELNEKEYGYFFEGKPLTQPSATSASSQEQAFSQKLQNEVFCLPPPPKRPKK